VRVYVGWQFAIPYADPGPRPKRPVPPERNDVSPAWVAAQRREERQLNRPLVAIAAVCAVIGACLLAAAVAGLASAVVAGLAITVCAIIGGMSGYAVLQGERAVRSRLAAERVRAERFRTDADSRLFAAQTEHASRVKDWQARRFAFDSQKRWYAVTLPGGVDRIDLAGGTLPGWSALATTIGACHLSFGGEVTVLDISGGSVAADLLSVAAGMGVNPLVWVLPADLARLNLTSGMDAATLADVLAVAGGGGGRELVADAEICSRVLTVVGVGGGPRGDGGASGGPATVERVVAGLRVLAGVGDPMSDVSAGLLTAEEVVKLSTLYGAQAGMRIVAERAWSLVSSLRKLASLGSAAPKLPRSPLRVLAVDAGAGTPAGQVLGTFVAAALTRLFRQGAPGPPWRHTLLVFGAERLGGEVVPQLCDACAASGTGLLLAYRSMTDAVRSRLGAGNAAVAFMRLGNAEDAKTASEHLGSEHRFVVAQLTETAGSSVTDTSGVSYTSTVSGSGSLSSSVSVTSSEGSGRGRSGSAGLVGGGVLPGGESSLSRESSRSKGVSSAESVTTGISQSSAWGRSVSLAFGDSESMASTVQRSRELLVEPHELQQLPVTALLLSYASAAGRSVILTDANPGIAALPAATMTPLAEAIRLAAPASQAPNLGPPPERLDWRRSR
jgi:hypothetical protein